MRLEQALSQPGKPSPLVSLGGEYVAFPRSLLGEVEKIARRAGLAVRAMGLHADDFPVDRILEAFDGEMGTSGRDEG